MTIENEKKLAEAVGLLTDIEVAAQAMVNHLQSLGIHD